MAFFPASPVDGQEANVGNITYQWSAAIGAWNRVGSTINNFIVDGSTVAITGNILCSGSGPSQFNANLNVLGGLLVAGAATTLSINTGNIQASNVSATTLTTSGALSAASISTSGAIIANGQISSLNALSSAQQVSAPLLTSSGAIVASGDITGGGNLLVPGNVSGLNVTSTGNILCFNNISASSNVSGGNVISVGNVSAVGNVSGTYILGNGAFLTGVVTGGGGGAGSRANVLINTGSIANAATFTSTVTLAKGYAVYKVITTDAAWVRLYSNAATQSADSGRSQDNDPQPGSGVMVEVITNGANTVLISPAAVGWNDDNPPSNAIPISVTNLSGGAADIGVTFTYLGIEL